MTKATKNPEEPNDQATDNSEAIAGLKAQVESLTKEKAELEEIVNTPNEENAALKARIEEIQEKAQEDVSKSDVALLNATKKIEELESSLSMNRETVATMTEKLEGNGRNSSTEIASLQSEIAKLKEKAAEHDEVIRQRDSYIEQVGKLTSIQVPKSAKEPIRLPATYRNTNLSKLATNTVYQIDVDGADEPGEAELIGDNLRTSGSVIIYKPPGTDQRFLVEGMQLSVETTEAKADKPATYRVVLSKVR